MKSHGEPETSTFDAPPSWVNHPGDAQPPGRRDAGLVNLRY
jgi:hypothetical protein